MAYSPFPHIRYNEEPDFDQPNLYCMKCNQKNFREKLNMPEKNGKPYKTWWVKRTPFTLAYIDREKRECVYVHMTQSRFRCFKLCYAYRCWECDKPADWSLTDSPPESTLECEQ